MSGPWECTTCHKRFATEMGARQHIRDKHPQKGGEVSAVRRHEADVGESMADLFVEAEINRAMGGRNDDWIEDMLP